MIESYSTLRKNMPEFAGRLPDFVRQKSHLSEAKQCSDDAGTSLLAGHDTWGGTPTTHERPMLTVLGRLAEFERNSSVFARQRAAPAPKRGAGRWAEIQAHAVPESRSPSPQGGGRGRMHLQRPQQHYFPAMTERGGTGKKRPKRSPDGSEIMKRRAPRDLSLRPARVEFDPRKAYTTDQLAEIGAITLKWNQIEAHIDFIGSHILFPKAPFWLRIATDKALSTESQNLTF